MVNLFKGQRGFTLIELMAVIAILTVLAGIVAGGVTGLGASGQNAKLDGDQNTIGKAANRFATDAFPETYPIERPEELVVKGIETVGIIDFNARLPQDPARKFVPDYLARVPDSAGLVSWRIDTATGNVFFTDEAALLVLPSTNQLDISATSRALGVISNYRLDLSMKKDEAALKVLKVEIPAGYSIGGQDLASGASVGTRVGTLVGKYSTDNPWKPGQEILYRGTLRSTGQANEWELEVNYDANCLPTGSPPSCTPSSTFGTPGGTSVNVKNRATGGVTDARTHKVSIRVPSVEVGGELTLTMDRGTDPDQNEATETWDLTVLGTVAGSNIITNPLVKKVYRWRAKEHTSIDPSAGGKNVFNDVAGNQAVIIGGRITGTPITLTFNTSPTFGRTYTEQGMIVTSLQDHLHMDGQTLTNHSGCCSTPYDFRFSMAGTSFDVVSVQVLQLHGTSTFTSSLGNVVTVTSTGTLNFPKTGWTGITHFNWHAASGFMVIDNLTVVKH